MKIAHDNKLFFFSYNILYEDKMLKRNITRERKDMSKEVYSSSLKAIIGEVKNRETLGKVLNSFLNSKEGSMSGELIYKKTILKVVSYALESRYNLVFFSTLDKDKYSTLYRDLAKDKKLKLIVLHNRYYNYIKNDKELSSKNIFAESYKVSYNEISLDKLSNEEREVYNWIKILINRYKISINISTIAITENKIISYESEKDKIIISRESLRCVYSCF